MPKRRGAKSKAENNVPEEEDDENDETYEGDETDNEDEEEEELEESDDNDDAERKGRSRRSRRPRNKTSNRGRNNKGNGGRVRGRTKRQSTPEETLEVKEVPFNPLDALLSLGQAAFLVSEKVQEGIVEQEQAASPSKKQEDVEDTKPRRRGRPKKQNLEEEEILKHEPEPAPSITVHPSISPHQQQLHASHEEKKEYIPLKKRFLMPNTKIESEEPSVKIEPLQNNELSRVATPVQVVPHVQPVVVASGNVAAELPVAVVATTTTTLETKTKRRGRKAKTGNEQSHKESVTPSRMTERQQMLLLKRQEPKTRSKKLKTEELLDDEEEEMDTDSQNETSSGNEEMAKKVVEEKQPTQSKLEEKVKKSRVRRRSGRRPKSIVEEEEEEEKEKERQPIAKEIEKELKWHECGKIKLKCRDTPLGTLTVFHKDSKIDVSRFDSVNINKRLPIEKLQRVAPAYFEFLSFETSANEEKEKLDDMYKILLKENMAGVVSSDDRMLIFIPQQSKLLTSFGVKDTTNKYFGAIFKSQQETKVSEETNGKTNTTLENTPIIENSPVDNVQNVNQSHSTLPSALASIFSKQFTPDQIAAVVEAMNKLQQTQQQSIGLQSPPSLSLSQQQSTQQIPQQIPTPIAPQQSYHPSPLSSNALPTPPPPPPIITSPHPITPPHHHVNVNHPLVGSQLHGRQYSQQSPRSPLSMHGMQPHMQPLDLLMHKRKRENDEILSESKRRRHMYPLYAPNYESKRGMYRHGRFQTTSSHRGGHMHVSSPNRSHSRSASRSPSRSPLKDSPPRSPRLRSRSRSPTQQNLPQYGTMYRGGRGGSGNFHPHRGSYVSYHPNSHQYNRYNKWGGSNYSRHPYDNRGYDRYQNDRFSAQMERPNQQFDKPSFDRHADIPSDKSRFERHNEQNTSPSPTSPHLNQDTSSPPSAISTTPISSTPDETKTTPSNEFDEKDSTGRQSVDDGSPENADGGSGGRGDKQHNFDNHEPTRHLWVGRFHNMKMDYSTLRNDFEQYGELESLNYLKDQKCAFVNFKNLEDARKAKRGLEGRLYPKVAFQQPRAHRDFRGATIYKSTRAEGELLKQQSSSSSDSQASSGVVHHRKPQQCNDRGKDSDVEMSINEQKNDSDKPPLPERITMGSITTSNIHDINFATTVSPSQQQQQQQVGDDDRLHTAVEDVLDTKSV